MNCAETQALLGVYLDQELDAVHAANVDAHLQACAVCQRHYAVQGAHHVALKQVRYFNAPPDLAAQIRAQLPRTASPATHVRQAFWLRFGSRLAAVGPSLVAMCLALWLGAVYLHPANTGDSLERELLDSHVRSLMGDHLTDVASTDQHTVKPWFNGRLDFSPPVSNWSAAGYPLIGGRLDYIDRHAVAALVYQRRKHYINVFVWPQAQADRAPSLHSMQGYHLVRWQQAGMAYAAVSDLDTAELMALVADIRRGAQAAQ